MKSSSLLQVLRAMTPSTREVDPPLRAAAAAAVIIVERCSGRLGPLRPIRPADFLPRFANMLPFGQPRGGSRYADGSKDGGQLQTTTWKKKDGGVRPSILPENEKTGRLRMVAHYAVRLNESDSRCEEPRFFC